MKLLLTICVFLLSANISIAQILKTPNREVEDAILFLEHNRNYDGVENIRFFSTYAIPEENREDAVLSLSFMIHSLAGIDAEGLTNNLHYRPLAIRKDLKFIPIQNVPGSSTLWWIDLRDYNWTIAAWEKAVKNDGYFVEPIVKFDRSGLLRLLGGNAIVRADWFIFHSSDTTAQDIPIYNTLLYAKITEPKNIDQWRKIWQLDIEKAELLGNEVSAITTKSTAVARHNRVLFGYNTELGYLYETYDVKEQLGKKDYIESFFLNNGHKPEKSDAGEAFATNLFGMQVYALRDGTGKLINDADAGVARHIADVNGDARVRVSTSCIDCHANGTIPSENTINEMLNYGISLNINNRIDKKRVEKLYKGDLFNEKIKQNKEDYAAALKNVNGLTPEENKDSYLNIIRWYAAPVTLKQASFELGLTETEFESKMFNSKVNRIPGRLMLLLHGEGVPRDIWDTKGKDGIPGMFQQAFITMNGLTIVNNDVIEVKNELTKTSNKNRPYRTIELNYPIILKIRRDTPIMSGPNIVKMVRGGDYIAGTGKIKEASGVLWHGVLLTNNHTVWVRAEDSIKVEKNSSLEHKTCVVVNNCNIIRVNTVIDSATRGERVVSSGVTALYMTDGVWTKYVGILMEDDILGYVDINYLELVR